MSNTLLNKQANRATSIATSIRQAEIVAADLVAASVEFHVEPLPQEHWRFTVKDEAHSHLWATGITRKGT